MAGGQKPRHIRKSIRSSAQYHRLSKKERKAEVALARVEVARQVKVLALELDIKLDDVARYLGVGVRSFYTWCAGGRIPSKEHYARLLELKGELEDGKQRRGPGEVVMISGKPPEQDYRWIHVITTMRRNP